MLKKIFMLGITLYSASLAYKLDASCYLRNKLKRDSMNSTITTPSSNENKAHWNRLYKNVLNDQLNDCYSYASQNNFLKLDNAVQKAADTFETMYKNKKSYRSKAKKHYFSCLQKQNSKTCKDVFIPLLTNNKIFSFSETIKILKQCDKQH